MSKLPTSPPLLPQRALSACLHSHSHLPSHSHFQPYAYIPSLSSASTRECIVCKSIVPNYSSRRKLKSRMLTVRLAFPAGKPRCCRMRSFCLLVFQFLCHQLIVHSFLVLFPDSNLLGCLLGYHGTFVVKQQIYMDESRFNKIDEAQTITRDCTYYP